MSGTMETLAPSRPGKRLLFVVEAMGGGLFTYIVSLANQLIEDYDVYLAYAVRPQTPQDYRDYFDSRIHLIEVEDFVRPISPRQDLRALAALIKIGRAVRPDIIHLHSAKAGVLGRLAYWRARVPVFYTPHGYSFLMRQASPLKRGLYRMIEFAMARLRSTTIACSKGELDETLPLTRRALLINNGIDPDEIDCCLDRLPGAGDPVRQERNSFTVFTIGRICSQKNPVLFNQIAHAMPDIRFRWIGDGELRELLDAPNIEVTGWVSRRDVLKLADQADCFLLPSSWEGLPISLLEAMYLEKPCVVSDVLGNRDVIRNGENGFVCHELEQFVAAIRKAEQSDVARALCRAALRDIEHEYNITVMARRYKGVYEQALAGSSACDGAFVGRAAKDLSRA